MWTTPPTLAGVIADPGDNTLQLCVEAERFVGDNWRIEAEACTLTNADAEGKLSAFKSDSFVDICVSRFFYRRSRNSRPTFTRGAPSYSMISAVA